MYDPFYQAPGNEIGKIYRLSKEDVKRMDGKRGELDFIRLEPGFPCLCIRHSGYAVNDYVVLDCKENGVKAILQSEFGAYSAEIRSKPLNWVPSKKEFHWLLAGEWVTVSPDETFPLMEELKALGHKPRRKSTVIGGNRISISHLKNSSF